VQTKEKKSFTLSHSSIVFLERLRKAKKAESTSQVLDELIRDAEARRKRRATDQAVADYYGALSDAERNENAAWGDFALAQISDGTELG
jgi:hypothetical protein